MRRWRSIGRCRSCKLWIAWKSRTRLSEAYCTCGEPLARTTFPTSFPTSSGARVFYCEPLAAAEAARLRARRVPVSERDRLLADSQEPA